MRQREPGDPSFTGDKAGWRCDLFDRHREPADQPRNLIQSLGIAILKGFCKPKQALVIAHGGDVAWNDRRHGPYEIGLDVWHRITSGESGAIEPRRGLRLFRALFVAQSGIRIAPRGARSPFAFGRKSQQIVAVQLVSTPS
jgi:hypothetical protein